MLRWLSRVGIKYAYKQGSPSIRGSHFTKQVEIAVKRNTNKTGSTASDLSSHPDRLVLIVEDDDMARSATKKFLQFCGYEVLTAKEPGTALELAEKMHPQVVICDYNLREKYDGIKVALDIQQKISAAIVFVTAYSRSSLKNETQGIMVSDWLRKPITLKLLGTVLDRVMKPN